jgi:hypothetical protein
LKSGNNNRDVTCPSVLRSDLGESLVKPNAIIWRIACGDISTPSQISAIYTTHAKVTDFRQL